MAQLYTSFFRFFHSKARKDSFWQHFMIRTGMVQNGERFKTDGKQFPVNRHKIYLRYSNFHQMTKDKRCISMWTNWWCRDQNFRKYFEMRKKHGIRPSLSGFYHEKIYDDYIKSRVSLHTKSQMRDYS